MPAAFPSPPCTTPFRITRPHRSLGSRSLCVFSISRFKFMFLCATHTSFEHRPKPTTRVQNLWCSASYSSPSSWIRLRPPLLTSDDRSACATASAASYIATYMVVASFYSPDDRLCGSGELSIRFGLGVCVCLPLVLPISSLLSHGCPLPLRPDIGGADFGFESDRTDLLAAASAFPHTPATHLRSFPSTQLLNV